jgi:hypothetical protein
MLSEEAARLLLGLLAGYGAGGLAVAVAFFWSAIERATPAARGAHAFRPLLVPGLVLLWPLVLWRWPPPDR